MDEPLAYENPSEHQSPLPVKEAFHWTERERLRALLGDEPFLLDPGGRTFSRPGVRVTAPLAWPPPPSLAGLDFGRASAQEIAAHRARLRSGAAPSCALTRYLEGMPAELPLQMVLLLQAGAATLGAFEAGEPLATKTRKAYVVRGNGRAQPTYLASKGKSRYGARLRLQNAVRLFDQTSAKLHEYWQAFGPPAQLFTSAPTRLWSDFLRSKRKPPFDDRTAIHRLPLDLPVPVTEVLLSTYGAMQSGTIERLD